MFKATGLDALPVNHRGKWDYGRTHYELILQ